MGRSEKDRSTSSSGQGSYARFGRWQDLRRSLDRGDLLHAKWSPSNQDSEEIRHDEEWTNYRDDAWSEVRKELLDMGSPGDYVRNKKRQDALISYAAPYRLNIETTSTTNMPGTYRLMLTDPNSFKSRTADIPRESVDTHRDPERFLRGHIDMMKKQLALPVYTAQQPYDDLVTVEALREYAKPFALTFNTVVTDGITMDLQLAIKSEDYGFKSDIVRVPPGDHAEILRKGYASIDKMHTELGWKKAIDEAENKVAQPVKPFVLECPKHGGAMSKVVDVESRDEYFVCLVPGCKKKARQKNRVQSGGFGIPPSSESDTSGSLGNLSSLHVQGEPSIEFQRRIAETPIRDTTFPPDSKIQIDISDSYYAAMNTPPWRKR
jgi:hypothetical protein